MELLEPLLRHAGDRLAALVGAQEGADIRLRRIHSALPATRYRIRQMSSTALGLFAGVLVVGATRPPPAVSALMIFGAPALAFMLVEQKLAHASEHWQEHLSLELPVVAEQLALLLNAGYSLGSALSRLAARSGGCIGRDLSRVVNRIQHGLSEAEALGEWREVAAVDGVTRLVAVLALHAETADLGRLVSAEARQCRRDQHRQTLEMIERRAEQVWIPVTVATLVPGAILLAVPFLAALRLFANA